VRAAAVAEGGRGAAAAGLRDAAHLGVSLTHHVRRKAQVAVGGRADDELLLRDGQALALLQAGKPARLTEPKDEDEARALKNAQLLTTKPVLYVCNVEEASAATGNALSEAVAKMAASIGASAVVVSAAIEAEIATMEPTDRQEYLESLGLHETGLARVVRAAYELLGLITFFTIGPKEARAWTVKRGSKAPQAAGEIHGDFEKKFIRAETISYDDFVTLGGENAAKDAGRLRAEGKEYVVADGDVMHILHGA
jgi:ribosome-binding ATPase YchF (GTP1/OBG family)